MPLTTYNSEQAAKLLGVSRATLLRWFRENRISPVGRDWRNWRVFTDESIERIRRELGQRCDATVVNSKMLAYLKKVPTFSRLQNEILLALAESARFRGFLKGSRFFSPGVKSSGLHLLVKGRIKILRLSPEGREQLLTVVTPFQTLGEAAIFRQSGTHSSYAICEESSTVLTLPSPKTRSLVVRYPELALAFLTEFATRIEDLEQRLEETALHPLERRLAAYLLKQANPENKLRLSESNSALAAQFGVSRESVSRTLTRFQEQALISRRGRSVVLLSPQALASL